MTSQSNSTIAQNKQPLVSIIMNCYNGEKCLREAIDSVFAQTYSNWEIIFWDNASTDATQNIAFSYHSDPRFKYFRAEINTPLGPARNIALKKATGDYIAFLDSDDVYLPNKLQKQIEMMESENFGLSYGYSIIINEDGKKTNCSKSKYRSGYILDKLLKRYNIIMSSAMIRRSVILENGFEFNESFKYAPDYNLFMKIAAKYSIGILHEFIVKYRRSSNSLSRKTLHLVSTEVGQTLDELQQLYPEVLNTYTKEMSEARSKLNFYDAISQVNFGNYLAARSALKSVINVRWEYLVIYLILFLPIPRKWMLRAFKR